MNWKGLIVLVMIVGLGGCATDKRVEDAKEGAIKRVKNYAKNQDELHNAAGKAYKKLSNSYTQDLVLWDVERAVGKAEKEQLSRAGLAAEVVRLYSVRDEKRAGYDKKIFDYGEMVRFTKKDLNDAFELIEGVKKYDDASDFSVKSAAEEVLND